MSLLHLGSDLQFLFYRGCGVPVKLAQTRNAKFVKLRALRGVNPSLGISRLSAFAP